MTNNDSNRSIESHAFSVASVRGIIRQPDFKPAGVAGLRVGGIHRAGALQTHAHRLRVGRTLQVAIKKVVLADCRDEIGKLTAPPLLAVCADADSSEVTVRMQLFLRSTLASKGCA